MVQCPNCKGKDSSRWPFGPCTICNGMGVTTSEKAAYVIANRKANGIATSSVKGANRAA